MKQLHTSEELYGEILKSFYFSEFPQSSQFLTQKETQRVYGVSRSTVEKVFKKLQQDSFLESRCHYGSIVTFDVNNPDHVAKVPLYHHDPAVREVNTFDFPLIMLSNVLYQGLCLANDLQLKQYRQDAEKIIFALEQEEPCFPLVKQWHFHIVENLKNRYLTEIFDHFFNRYLYFNSKPNLPPEHWQQLCACMRQFYQEFLSLLEERDFARFIPLKRAYYEAIYEIPDALLFSKLEEELLFQEGHLYYRLLHAILFDIHAYQLKKGDFLPTIDKASKRYHVGAKTVRNAYDVLSDIGLIGRKQGSGTILIANLDDSVVKGWIMKRFLERKNQLEQMMDAMILIDDSILRNTASTLPNSVLEQMRKQLEEQRRVVATHDQPYLVTDVLVTPVVMSIPVGVLHKYYFYIHRPAAEFASVCGLEHGVTPKNNKEVYQLLCMALDALSCGDSDAFVTYTIRAQRLNAKQMMQKCEETVAELLGAEGQSTQETAPPRSKQIC